MIVLVSVWGYWFVGARFPQVIASLTAGVMGSDHAVFTVAYNI